MKMVNKQIKIVHIWVFCAFIISAVGYFYRFSSLVVADSNVSRKLFDLNDK